MKKIKLFLEYNRDIDARVNDILDKISQHGIESLSDEEKKFLDAQKDETSAEKALDDYNQKIVERTFEDDTNRFKFHLKRIDSEDSNSDDGILTTYYGIMELPDLTTGDGKTISGEIEGEIILNEIGLALTNFEKDGYTDYDFTEGLEYEYDNFITGLSIDLQNL